eukprot:scaffold9120_cov151-Isochrysis_galbana.AAC.10
MVWVGGRANSRKLYGRCERQLLLNCTFTPRPRDSGRCVDANSHPSRAARTEQKEKRNAKGGRGARRTRSRAAIRANGRRPGWARRSGQCSACRASRSPEPSRQASRLERAAH